MATRIERHLAEHRNDKNVTPDGHVYKEIGGGWNWFCAACVDASIHPARNRDSAHALLTLHLWSVHCWRRVYITQESPARDGGIQIALPLVIAHDSTRHAS
jgi:hypothetical protein